MIMLYSLSPEGGHRCQGWFCRCNSQLRRSLPRFDVMVSGLVTQIQETATKVNVMSMKHGSNVIWDIEKICEISEAILCTIMGIMRIRISKDRVFNWSPSVIKLDTWDIPKQDLLSNGYLLRPIIQIGYYYWDINGDYYWSLTWIYGQVINWVKLVNI